MSRGESNFVVRRLDSRAAHPSSRPPSGRDHRRRIFLGGQALGGIPGIMLAVPLTAFLVTAWRLVRRKYFNAA